MEDAIWDQSFSNCSTHRSGAARDVEEQDRRMLEVADGSLHAYDVLV